jgi:hypothetical protein
LATGVKWILVPLSYGFFARVLTGPTLSPLGQVVTRVITPKLNFKERLTAGPSKRFAQGMGFVMSFTPAVLVLGFGERFWGVILVMGITLAAILESVFAFCIGCKVFAFLMRLGVISTEVCQECNNIQRATTQLHQIHHRLPG